MANKAILIQYFLYIFLMYACSNHNELADSNSIKPDTQSSENSILKNIGNSNQVINHNITIRLDPVNHELQASDVIKFPTTLNKWDFLLHEGLRPILHSSDIPLVPLSENASSNIHHYRIESQSGFDTVTIEYRGKIHHPIEQQSEEYERSFSETAGIIDAQGIFLSQSSYWYPISKNALVSFRLDISLPSEWSAVSQGERLLDPDNKNSNHVIWVEHQAQDEIYLVAGKFHTYDKMSDSVNAMVYLLESDDSLAQKYLATTIQYVDMYRRLLGPYPYTKFALVENFWDTGYGMPSFTLLGSKVIRFPFILHSSFPHEILHNWWGNSVYVDYEKGNWSEGLTSYLADHLIQEQRGFGTLYRRNTLQKYTDYVDQDRDFPLIKFTSRHSSATEAVGYGKTMMLFHMLRMELGDVLFIKALQEFYRQFKFTYATFDDIQTIFSSVGKKDFTSFFRQWVQRTGAPELSIDSYKIKESNKTMILDFTLVQQNDGEPYDLNIPIAVRLEKKPDIINKSFHMNQKRMMFSMQLPGKPIAIEIDSEFDVFRKLNIHEIPPALSRLFGAQKILIVLPSKAAPDIRENYLKLATIWKESQHRHLEIVYDDKLTALPDDYSVWLFGWNNVHLDWFKQTVKDYNVQISSDKLQLDSKEFFPQQHAVVLSARNPVNQNHAIAWLADSNTVSMPNLGRKLPHYGKYSYLVFEGENTNNIVKGQWPIIHSPLKISLSTNNAMDNTNSDSSESDKKTSIRPALAELAPVFSHQAMMSDIQFLSKSDMQGRGVDSIGLDAAADYIANEFKKAGLEPGGDADSSYFQIWEQNTGPANKLVTLKNVIGILPGNDSQSISQSVIVSAHYDHLGLGWPDVHLQDKGLIHPGADDNASGVAVMLEMARVFARDSKPDRSILFVAFTGEEIERLGSRYFVKNYKKYSIENTIGVLNLDTVGRLNENKLIVFGTGSAREWIHIFRGAGFVTGIDVQSVQTDIGSSDQKSFTDFGIPAVQLFSGTHTDFHRPSDTIEKIDANGLVKVATILNEALEYLSTSAASLSSTLQNTTQASTIPKKQNPTSKVESTKTRKVSLGTIPDYTYPGPGVKISGTAQNSPAQNAGLNAADIIQSINGEPIADLRDFAQKLKQLKPGSEIEIHYLRNNVGNSIKVQVEER